MSFLTYYPEDEDERLVASEQPDQEDENEDESLEPEDFAGEDNVPDDVASGAALAYYLRANPDTADDDALIEAPDAEAIEAKDEWREFYDQFIAEHGAEALESQTVADTLRTAFFSGMSMALQPQIMITAMQLGPNFGRALAAYWTEQYFRKVMKDCAFLEVIGTVDDFDVATFGQEGIQVDELMAHGLELYKLALNKQA